MSIFKHILELLAQDKVNFMALLSISQTCNSMASTLYG